MENARYNMARITFDPTKISKVSIDSINPNTWNPKDSGKGAEYEKVVKGMQIKGLRGFIVVREHEGSYEILDGEQRYTAAKQLGFKEMFIYNEGNISDKEAKELTILWQSQVPFDSVKEAYLVNELVLEAPENIELPYSELELEEMKELAAFDFEQYANQSDDNEENDNNLKTIKIAVTLEQYEIIMNALSDIMEKDDCTESTALERMAADYLSGVGL